MKIGIDIRALSGRKTGIGRYLDNLLQTLLATDTDNQYILFCNAFKGSNPPKYSGNVRVISGKWPNKILFRLWARTSFPKAERFVGDVDVFHGPNFQMAPVKKAATVLTVHDLVFCVSPELASPVAVKEYFPFIKRYAQRADLIVAISNSTAADIVSCLNVPGEKVVTVYPGTTKMPNASDDEIRKMKERYGIKGDFIFFAGNLEPRKNLVRLIRAFDCSRLCSDFMLVLAGPKGWYSDEIFKTWRMLACKDRIVWLDYLGDENLSALYSSAAFLAFPSLMEGFGLPILEAMSVGCPVLTSNISSMPEVGGEAAFYVDPLDIDSITEGLRRLAGDGQLRRRLSAAGYERVTHFTWEVTARRMIDIYGKAQEMRGRRSQCGSS